MKKVISVIFILLLASCSKKVTNTTTSSSTTTSETSKVESKIETKKDEDSGLRPNVSFVNTNETEMVGKYSWAKVNYIYQITKDLRRNDLYDVTIKKPFAGKDSGGHQTTFVTSMSTLKEVDKYTVKMRFAEKKSEYEWKPNPASYIDCIFDLKAGKITYNLVGTHWQKFQQNNSVVKTMTDKNLTTTKAMSIAVEYIIANYNGAFAK
jgi:hypothetical protein